MYVFGCHFKGCELCDRLRLAIVQVIFFKSHFVSAKLMIVSQIDFNQENFYHDETFV